jgi:predicted Zn-dependent protease
VEDRELFKYVNLICATITENSSIYDEEFTVVVLNDDKVNAFAVPGGYIFVTKGMISICRDESELAGVIAHEVAHVIRRHGLQEISKRAANIAADKAFDELDEEVGKTEEEVDLEEMIESTYDKVLHPRLIKYELEGDKVGSVLLANAGYDPFGLVRISQRIASLPKEQADIFDANFMAPNGAVERYNAIVRFSNRQFKTTNPGATLSERFAQNRIR